MCGKVLGIILSCAVLTDAYAWEVVQWGDNGLLYDTVLGTNNLILRSSGTYKFYALDGGTLADIGSITVDSSVTGAVTVHILRDDGTNGVVNLGSVNLESASPGRLAECRVQNNAGVGGSIVVDELRGPVVIGGAVDSPVTVSSEFRGSFSCAALGDFTAAMPNVVSSGSISVAGRYDGVMTITGNFGKLTSLTLGGIGAGGSVVCGPNVGDGGVTINGDVSGLLDLVGFSQSTTSLTVQGSIASGGAVFARKRVDGAFVSGDIAGNLSIRSFKNPTPGNPDPELKCDGSVTGLLTVGPATNVFIGTTIEGDVLGVVDIDAILTGSEGKGYLRVLGALGNSNDPGEIVVNGISSLNAAYICVNYDGCSDAALDVWYPNSNVTVGSTDYSEPNYAVYVHAGQVACGPGDMNGDLVCDFADIDPFVAILSDAPTDLGLQASVLFRADINRDGLINFADIDPFVALIGTPCSCGTTTMMAMASFRAPESGTLTSDPLELAEALRDNVSAENLPTLLDAIAQLVATPPAGAQVDWPLVQQHLQ